MLGFGHVDSRFLITKEDVDWYLYLPYCWMGIKCESYDHAMMLVEAVSHAIAQAHRANKILR